MEQTKIDINNWSGVLTLENLEAVAKAIEEKLTGMAYTWIARNRYFPDDHLEVRKHQALNPKGTYSGKAVSCWTHEDESHYGGFNVSDTSGVWGAATFDDAHFTFAEMGIFISQSAPAGHRLHWIILIEGKQEEEAEEA